MKFFAPALFVPDGPPSRSAVRFLKPCLFFILCALPLSGSGCSEDEEDSWQLVWEDDFDGPADSRPSTSNWQFDIGTDWGNAQLEYDTDEIRNVSLDGDGHLRITAREEAYNGRNYTSGRITTADRFEQAYGRFEARIRLPIGQGIWPAFWLLGSDFGRVGWPECGEIDILEYRGQDPRFVHGSVHGPGYSGGGAITGSYDLGTSFADDFHVFAVEWEREQITWLVDGIRYQTMSIASLPPGGRWVFDHPFFIILNVAVGGNYVGNPDASTPFPQTMLIDYVRVYKGRE